ncbi:MAG: ATP-dependent zinc metalloprotease FtsH [Clostridia bacterium]|nr:ATP-dependent zinc metalloprotease FtsH [Clostridia bacterium]
MKNQNKTITIIISIILIGILIVSILPNILGEQTKEIKYTEFITEAKNGNLAKVEVEGQFWAYGYKTADSKIPEYKTKIFSREGISNDLKDETGKYITAVSLDDPNASAWVSYILPYAIIIIVAIIFMIIMKNMQSGGPGINNFGKSKARMNENVKVRFSDVAGAEEEKEELQEIVEFLKNPKKFSELGAKIPRGVLMIGPPGTGKTLFAKAIAGEANVPFFSISGSDFVEMYVGVGAARVRDLFENAKKNAPCIVFIDEIDAVGRQRGAGLGGGNDEREQTLNQLLVQMDGFETNDGIIVIAATNRSDVLDPALLRPGRFDRQIVVNIPDVKGREAIFKVHARNKPISPDINFKELARITSGFTGADIANLLNEAAILAARNDRKIIMQVDINEAINKVVIGPQKKSRIITESDKRITAYHEAGHAILAKVLKGNDPVHEVSIIPRGMAAGYTMTMPDSDDQHVSKSKLLDKIAMVLGGRTAEEIIIKDICTGAESDLKHATSLAKSMVMEWGMSEVIGAINIAGGKEVFLGRDYQEHNPMSEALAAKVDEEIRRIVEDCHKVATEKLNEYKFALENMARLLIERETIYATEVDMLVEGKSLDEIREYIKEQDQKIEDAKKDK